MFCARPRHRVDRADDRLQAGLIDADRASRSRCGAARRWRSPPPDLAAGRRCRATRLVRQRRAGAALAGHLRERQRGGLAHIAVFRRSMSIWWIARSRSFTSPFDSDGKRRAMSACCGMPRRSSNSARASSRIVAEERQRRRAVELELEERAHDRRAAAVAERVIEADEVARRLHVLLHDVHRQHLAVPAAIHHQRAEARLGDDAPARDAELGVAAEELGIARDAGSHRSTRRSERAPSRSR